MRQTIREVIKAQGIGKLPPSGVKFKKPPRVRKERTAPWQIHSQTSQDAAFAIKPHTSRLLEVVFAVIANSPNGATDQEIEEATGLGGSTVGPRRGELLQDRRIKSAGTRPTKSGRQATVWITSEGEK